MSACAVLLILCAVVHLLRAACFGGFTQDGQTTHTLRPNLAQTWAQLEAGCAAAHPGNTLLQLTDLLDEAALKDCGLPLLPFGVYMTAVPWEGRKFHWSSNLRTPSDSYTLRAEDFVNADHSPGLLWPINGVGVVNVTTGVWHLVDSETRFECALCQIPLSEDFRQVESDFIPDEWRFLTQTFDVVINVVVQDELEPIKTPEQQQLSNNETLRLNLELIDIFKATNLTVLHRSETNRQGRVELHFHVYFASERELLAVTDNSYSFIHRKIGGHYEITAIEFFSVCPFWNETGNFKLVEDMQESMDWYALERNRLGYFGTVEASVDADQELFASRQCVWNNATSALGWSGQTFWRVRWRNCSVQDQEAVERGANHKLAPIFASRAAKKLVGLSLMVNDCTELDEVAEIVSKVVLKGNNLPVNTLKSVFQLLSKVDMKSETDFCSSDKERFHIIVANLSVDNHVTGFTVPYKDKFIEESRNTPIASQSGPFVLGLSPINDEKMSEICLISRETSGFANSSSEFAISISSDLVTEFQQLSFGMAVTKSFAKDVRTSSYFVYDREVDIVLTSPTNKSLFLDDENYYIDLKFHWIPPDNVYNHSAQTSCLTRNTLTNAWTTMACRERKSLQESHTVCRCRAKHMTLEGGTLTGAFALKTLLFKDNKIDLLIVSLKGTIFEDVSINLKLIIFSFFECLVSSLGLLSIVTTAIFNQAWREDTGHKILLHMVMALTFNLALGFITDFGHFDTESVGCIVVGVLRHYSFLAMFLWMLVLSHLQMKRLMTVAGSKVTSHLILKAALFAWGVPLLPIIVLLAWNARIYRSDRYDRGYCYPEGIFFQVTVQAPAAFILLVNLLIFVAILRHIFECCSGDKITKHSKNERAQQMRRVATSVFIFFLFGFTWVLHYLSEERLIKSDFLFEYLFLMTATTHISVLALFFVVLDEKARAFWLQTMGKKSSSGK